MTHDCHPRKGNRKGVRASYGRSASEIRSQNMLEPIITSHQNSNLIFTIFCNMIKEHHHSQKHQIRKRTKSRTNIDTKIESRFFLDKVTLWQAKVFLLIQDIHLFIIWFLKFTKETTGGQQLHFDMTKSKITCPKVKADIHNYSNKH